MATTIEKALEALDRMLKESVKPRRTGPPFRKKPERPEKGPRPRVSPNKRRPVKTKPNAPGGSKPKRKRTLKKPKVIPFVGTTKGSSY